MFTKEQFSLSMHGPHIVYTCKLAGKYLQKKVQKSCDHVISSGGEQSSYNFTSIWTFLSGRILAESLVPGTKYATNKSFSPAALVIWIAPCNKLVHYCFNLTFKQITFGTFI